MTFKLACNFYKAGLFYTKKRFLMFCFMAQSHTEVWIKIIFTISNTSLHNFNVNKGMIYLQLNINFYRKEVIHV